MTDSAYSYSDLNTAGITIADASTIQAEVQAEYQAAFGTALNVTSPNTPQGLLINAETQARVALAANNANLANQINPNLAGGVFLDAILALMGAQRLAETYSIVYLTLAGSSGTVIPAGSTVLDPAGYYWAASDGTTIPLSGSITGVAFQCVTAGAITLDASSALVPSPEISGWNTASNPAANTVTGSETQSDVQARQYRLNTLYLQGSASAGSIIAAISNTTGVSSLTFVENDGVAQTIDGISMNDHSIYVCVSGGDDGDIAAALTASKAAGVAYTNGASATNVTYSYTVPFSGQVIDVLFDRPDIIQIGVKATVTLMQPLNNYLSTIETAILNYANGSVSGLPGLVVGQSVSPFEIASAISIQYPQVYVTKLEVQNITASGSLQTTQIDLDKWEQAQIQQSNILVVLG